MKSYDLTIKECLEFPPLNRFEILTGDVGLDKIVEAVTVLEAPDGVYWTRGKELLLTTGYCFRNNKQQLLEAVPPLAERGLSALIIKTNRFLYSLPNGLIEKCLELKLPLIQVPSDIAWRDIIGPIEEELSNRRYLQYRSNFLNQYLPIIEEQDSMAQIIDFLSNQIQLPVLLFNKRENLICYSRNNLPLLQIGSSIQSVEKTIANLNINKFPLANNALSYGTLLVASSSHILFSVQRIIEDSLPILAVQVINEIKKQTISESEYLYSIIVDNTQARDNYLNMSSNYLDYTQQYVCGVFGLHELILCPDEELHSPEYLEIYPVNKMLEETLKQLSKLRQINAKIVPNGREIIVLFPVERPSIPKEEMLTLVSEFRDCCRHLMNGRAINVGIGATVRAIAECHINYKEASKALVIGTRVAGGNSIIHYNDLGIYSILDKINNLEELERCFRSSIDKLIDFDKENNSSLCMTFEAFCRNDFHIKRTSQELHLHYNSLQYRLRRISEITNLDIQSSEGIFCLMFGQKVKKLLTKTVI